MKKLISAILILSFFSLSALSDEEKIQAQDQTQAQTSDSTNGRVPVSTGRYITGGILGTTVGYGIGHAIQGRFKESGWIFTTGESVGTLLMLSGLSSCINSAFSFSSSCNSSTLTAGTGIFLGFHIWEIVSVWTGATPVEEKTQTYLVPNRDGLQVGMLWNF